jgi:outer membrane protein TolC
MEMVMKQFILAILVVILPAQIFGQSISLDEFIDQVKLTHPLMKREPLSPAIAKINKNKQLTAQDWFAISEISYLASKPIQTSPFSPSRIDRASFNADFSRSFWSTGGKIALGWSSIRLDQDLQNITIPSPEGPSTIPVGASKLYENSVSISYSQPLWRNIGGKLDRLDYDLSNYEIEIAELQSLENQEKFLLGLTYKFLDWVLLEEERRIATERLELAREQLAHSKDLREANLVDQVDVLRSEDAVRSARQNLVLIESQIAAARAELAVLAQNEEINSMQPDYDIYDLIQLPDIEIAFDSLRVNSRLVKTLEEQAKQLEDLQLGFMESGDPSLDFGIGVGLKGGDEAFASSMELLKPDFSVSLTFSQQLGARASKADADRTRVQIEQVEYQKMELLLSLESSLRNLSIQINDLEKVLALNQQEIESAIQRTEEEVRLYNQGRVELTFVIQSRDNIRNAQLLYARNAANYHKLLLQYRELTDRLLEYDI